MKTDVLIIGAGAAGLMVARELSKAGKKVVILEARDRVGGRIYPLPKEEWGYEAQAGGEIVHDDAPVTQSLLKEAGITVQTGGEWWSVISGEPKKVEGPVPRDPLLTQRLNELTEDITIKEFFDRYFADSKYDSIRNEVFRRVEGYLAADPARASVFVLRDEANDEQSGENAYIKEGYGTMIHYLKDQCEAQGVEILLNQVVEAIDWAGEGVLVRCSGGLIYQSSAVVVTVPLPLIQTITFTPQIPEKLEAAANIGYGPVIKILLKFKAQWWKNARGQNFENLVFMFSREAIPTWWTQYPEPRPVLTGWIGGPAAEAFVNKSEQEVEAVTLSSLSNIFQVPVDTLMGELERSKIVYWSKDPYAQGAYSYSTPKSAAARKELLKSVDSKVFFAGEAIYEGKASATVEAALGSGLQTASSILNK